MRGQEVIGSYEFVGIQEVLDSNRLLCLHETGTNRIHYQMGLLSCQDLESNNNWCENNRVGHANQSLGLAISIAIIMDTEVKRVLGKFIHITTTNL